MTMTHPGLPDEWGIFVCISMIILVAWALRVPPIYQTGQYSISLIKLPVISTVIKFLTYSPWPLFILKLIMVLLFLLVIATGLFGTPIPERNLATVLTWNIWWAGLIVSVFFLGSAWCAVCPWDTLASWLVRRRLWFRAHHNNSLNLVVPKQIRNLWPALLMFIILTWLELGFGITTNPYMTALLALLMVVMATISLAVFENKAFCRYFCPVGRTVGMYSQLAPVELRPIDNNICASCTTLECYHGSETIEPCPTHLVMGRLKQNTYCTSCGNCSQSCPEQNIAWRLRPPSQEAIQDARPHWDEAWFMLCLLALTAFHGVTMMSFFEDGLTQLATIIDDSGQLLWSFTILLSLSLLIPMLIYLFFVWLTGLCAIDSVPLKKCFSGLAFVALPLAFAYHLAHNLNHLVRESDGFGKIVANPLGMDTMPLSMMEKHIRHSEMLLQQDLLFALQAGLMVFGFWISMKVIQYRSNSLLMSSGWRLLPMIGFAVLFTGFHLWLLMQPMTMRM